MLDAASWPTLYATSAPCASTDGPSFSDFNNGAFEDGRASPRFNPGLGAAGTQAGRYSGYCEGVQANVQP